jgi:hypothetical protein
MAEMEKMTTKGALACTLNRGERILNTYQVVIGETGVSVGKS